MRRKVSTGFFASHLTPTEKGKYMDTSIITVISIGINILIIIIGFFLVRTINKVDSTLEKHAELINKINLDNTQMIGRPECETIATDKAYDAVISHVMKNHAAIS